LDILNSGLMRFENAVAEKSVPSGSISATRSSAPTSDFASVLERNAQRDASLGGVDARPNKTAVHTSSSGQAVPHDGRALPQSGEPLPHRVDTLAQANETVSSTLGSGNTASSNQGQLGEHSPLDFVQKDQYSGVAVHHAGGSVEKSSAHQLQDPKSDDDLIDIALADKEEAGPNLRPSGDVQGLAALGSRSGGEEARHTIPANVSSHTKTSGLDEREEYSASRRLVQNEGVPSSSTFSSRSISTDSLDSASHLESSGTLKSNAVLGEVAAESLNGFLSSTQGRVDSASRDPGAAQIAPGAPQPPSQPQYQTANTAGPKATREVVREAVKEIGKEAGLVPHSPSKPNGLTATTVEPLGRTLASPLLQRPLQQPQAETVGRREPGRLVFERLMHCLKTPIRSEQERLIKE